MDANVKNAPPPSDEPEASSALLRAELDAMALAEEEAVDSLDATRNAYRTAQIGDCGEDELVLAKVRVERAEIVLDRAKARREDVSARLDVAVEREARQRRLADYRAADAAAEASARDVASVLHQMQALWLPALRRYCEAQIAVAKVNAGLADGMARLAGPEQRLRGEVTSNDRVLSERREYHWCHAGSDSRVPEDRLQDVVRAATLRAGASPDAVATGTLRIPSSPNMAGGLIEVEMRPFLIREIEKGRSGFRVDVARELVLPGVRAGDPPLWSSGPASRAEEYLARLQEMEDLRRETADQPPRPKIVTEIILIRDQASPIASGG